MVGFNYPNIYIATMSAKPQFETNLTTVTFTDMNKPVKKSWALMAIESEEEEEAKELEEEIQRQHNEQMKIRRELYAKGQYELEEGEILE